MASFECKTMQVKMKGVGDAKPIVINESDYDSKLHTKVRKKLEDKKEDKKEDN